MSARRRSAPRGGRGRQRQSLGTVLVFLALAAIVYLYDEGWFDRWLGEPAPPPSRSAPKSNPEQIETNALAGYSNGAVQVYFTRPSYPERSSNRQGGLDETVAADIDRAQRSVDLATFDFDLPLVADALTRATARGVAVRLVVDGENLETPEVAQLTGELQQAGIPITFDRRSAFMHNKFVVLDGGTVWTGSWNVTVNDTFRNDNNMLRIADARIAQNYTRKFEALFAGPGGGESSVPVPNRLVEVGDYRVLTTFAPQDDITGEVVRALNEARTSVDVLAFVFTSDPISEALIAAQDRGVRVRGVIERRNVEANGSEMANFLEAGMDVREDGNCYIMHNKVFVIDGQRVVTGSFNWSRQAQESNDENVVFVDSSWLAQRYADEVERIYEQAANPARCGS